MGLVGYPLEHSFSKIYFENLFQLYHIHGTYEVYEVACVNDIVPLFQDTAIVALNITAPYKEQVISYLDELDEDAKHIGAVNLVIIHHSESYTKGYWTKGYNTDWYGFMKSIQPLVQPTDQRALILGSGGAARAVNFGLKKIGIQSTFISRNPQKGTLVNQLSEQDMDNIDIIINATPCGMFPNTEEKPIFPYSFLRPKHFMYDLIYNPKTTLFLRYGEQIGARTKNGYEMLTIQANEAWKIITTSMNKDY